MKPPTPIQTGEIFILRLFHDKRFDIATVGLVALLLTTAVPTLAPQEPIIMIGMFALIAILIHGFTLSDVQGAGATPPTDITAALIAEIEALIAALATNTTVTATNSAVVTQADVVPTTINVQPGASVSVVGKATPSDILAPPPSRTTDAHAPQPVDPARASG